MKIQYDAPGVRVFESALFKTTSTVIATPDLVLVVDPNWLPEEVAAIQHYVESIQNDRPLWLLFTHSDYDHIIGYGAFANAKTIASEAFATQTDQAAALEQVQQWDEQYYIVRNYPLQYPHTNVAAKHGQTLSIGSTQLTFYAAPGHNGDGLFTLVAWENECIWIAGDYLSDVEFPFIYHSSHAYEQTLLLVPEIMANHRPQLLIPGHGTVTASAEEILLRQQDSLRYIHRLRTCIREGAAFDEATLWQRYHFRKGQEAFHQGNIALMRKELIAAGKIIA